MAAKSLKSRGFHHRGQSAPGDGSPSFILCGNISRLPAEAGLWLRFYYFHKRVNDFYFFSENESMILLFGVGREYDFTDGQK